MTINEAIEHAERMVLMCKDAKCAADKQQLVKWLRQARGAEKAAKWYTAKIRELENRSNALEILISEKDAENDKLRELVRDAWGDGHPDKSCGDCEIMDECHAEIEEAHKNGNSRWNSRCLFERRIEDRMHKLGI